MPPNIQVAAFVFGAVLVLIALLGGGFELFGAKILAPIGKKERIVAGVLGTIFIIAAAIDLFARLAPLATPMSSPIAMVPTVATTLTLTESPTLAPTAIPTSLLTEAPTSLLTEAPIFVSTTTLTPSPKQTSTNEPSPPKPTSLIQIRPTPRLPTILPNPTRVIDRATVKPNTPTSTPIETRTYQVDVVGISQEEVVQLNGGTSFCIEHNSCNVYIDPVGFALNEITLRFVWDNGKNGQARPGDDRLITVNADPNLGQVKITIQSDTSGSPINTIGNNRFTVEYGKFYKLVITRL